MAEMLIVSCCLPQLFPELPYTHNSASTVTNEDRIKLAGQQGVTIWLTGLSGTIVSIRS